MRALAGVATGLAVVAWASPAGAAAEAAWLVRRPAQTLDIAVGSGGLLRLDAPAATVLLADPAIADVRVQSPRLLYVVGKAAGSTTLYALDARDQVVSSLRLSVGYDLDRLRRLLAAQAPDAEVEVTASEDAVILSGRVSSAADGAAILRAAEAFVRQGRPGSGGQVINRLAVVAPDQVYLRVRIAEVSREARRRLDFNWQALQGVGSATIGVATGSPVLDGAGAVIWPTGGAGAGLASVRDGRSDLNVLLDALEQKREVRTLAEPNLTAVSGETASFLAGGEYPIPVPQDQSRVTIAYKQYGVSLAFRATILDGGRISLNVRPEVSQLSTNGAITLDSITVPALVTRRVETTVELGSGQSLAIAGLLQGSATQDLARLPGLGDLPVLGPLFRSKAFERGESELVIIVTPFVVQPTSRPLERPGEVAPRVAAPAPESSAGGRP